MMAFHALIQILNDSVLFLLLIVLDEVQRGIHLTHFDKGCCLVVFLLELLEDATEILL